MIISLEFKDQFYIGGCIKLSYGKTRHFRLLRYCKHPNYRLQAHFDKYGITDLKFKILESVPQHKVLQIHQEYLDKAKPTFNICRIAGTTIGRPQSLEARKKRSESLNGFKHSQETRLRMSVSAKRRKLNRINGNSR